MPEVNFFDFINVYMEKVQQVAGTRLDEHLSGYRISDAVHFNIDPSIEAIVRTELLIDESMTVDLRELVDVGPPVEGRNFFITFSAESANFQGGNATDFGIHLTRLQASHPAVEILDGGVFVPGTLVSETYQALVYLKAPNGNINLAKTGVAVGLDKNQRLVAYLTFPTDQGLEGEQSRPPSRITDADRQVLLYVFLSLSTFMTVNQGEAPVEWLSGKSAIIG